MRVVWNAEFDDLNAEIWVRVPFSFHSKTFFLSYYQFTYQFILNSKITCMNVNHDKYLLGGRTGP